MLRLTMVLAGSLMFLASSAQAITLSISVATNPGDSGFEDSSFTDFERDSATSVVDAGGSAANSLGASVTAGTRYAEYAWADNGFGVTNPSFTADYRVTLDITGVSVGTIFDLEIDTSRLGALTLVEDCCFGSTMFASASIGALTALVNGTPDGGLAMAALSLNDPVSLSGSPLNQDINQSSTVTLSGLNSSNTQFVLDFTWMSEVFSNNDEAALRLGLESSVPGVSADDYPGVGSRTIADDGHFVGFTATVTAAAPEPTLLLLMVVGFAVVRAARV